MKSLTLTARVFAHKRVRTHFDSTRDQVLKFIFLLPSKKRQHNETKSQKKCLNSLFYSFEGEGELEIYRKLLPYLSLYLIS